MIQQRNMDYRIQKTYSLISLPIHFWITILSDGIYSFPPSKIIHPVQYFILHLNKINPFLYQPVFSRFINLATCCILGIICLVLCKSAILQLYIPIWVSSRWPFGLLSSGSGDMRGTTGMHATVSILGKPGNDVTSL